jgi:hypothetical protein
VLALQGLVLESQIRLNDILEPLQGRHLDHLVRLTKINLF